MSDNTFSIIQYSVSGHLAYDIIYYVESKENEALNAVMRAVEQSGMLLFANTEMQPFPFKLQCLSQADLSAEHLQSQVSIDCQDETVAQAIDALRDCLGADIGGVLSVRCLPGHNEDSGHCDIFTCEEFGHTAPKDALSNVKTFARAAAMENFRRLSDCSYMQFLRGKEEKLHPRRHSSNGTMAFFIDSPDPNEIIRKMRSRLDELTNTINEQTEYNDIVKTLENDLKALKNEVKYNKPCKLKVEWNEIYVDFQGKWEQVKLGRYALARVLYIFYLQLIQIAEKNNSEPIYVSRVELQDYQTTLLKIYKELSKCNNLTIRDIESLWDKSINNFDLALSSIRNYFRNEFDVNAIKKNYGKCYTIEIMGKDKYGNSSYGIKLDPDDFELGWFSIYKNEF